MKTIIIGLFIIAIVAAFMKMMPAAGRAFDRKIDKLEKDEEKEGKE